MKLQRGDIVQITDEGHHWWGALIVVDEVKSFGCQGFAPVPLNDGTMGGQAYIRLKRNEFQPVGHIALEMAE